MKFRVANNISLMGGIRGLICQQIVFFLKKKEEKKSAVGVGRQQDVGKIAQGATIPLRRRTHVAAGAAFFARHPHQDHRHKDHLAAPSAYVRPRYVLTYAAESEELDDNDLVARDFFCKVVYHSSIVYPIPASQATPYSVRKSNCNLVAFTIYTCPVSFDCTREVSKCFFEPQFPAGFGFASKRHRHPLIFSSLAHLELSVPASLR